MKKTILTTIVALFCLSASAQFRVTSEVSTPADGDSWSIDNFTNSIGVGYDISNSVMVGIIKNGEDYDLAARFSLNDNIYLSVQAPQEEATDNLTLGVGITVHLWDNLYVEPNYTTKDDEGSFNVGLSYRL